jgi:D-threonine aldolase
VISFPPGEPRPPLGGRVLIGATHCDPTVNLHAAYYVVRGNVTNRWPICARYGA